MVVEVLGMVLEAVVAGALIWESQRPARVDPLTGLRVVPYGWVLRSMPLAGCAAMGFMVWVCFQGGVPDGVAVFSPIIFGLLALGCLGGATELMTYRLVVGDRGITASSAWKLPVELAWQDIEAVAYPPGSGFFTIRGRRGEVIRVPRMAAGIEGFVAACRRQLPRPTCFAAGVEFARVEGTL